MDDGSNVKVREKCSLVIIFIELYKKIDTIVTLSKLKAEAAACYQRVGIIETKLKIAYVMTTLPVYL